MGIHLFNPSEPFANSHRRCGTCTGVPKFWKLIIPEYSIGTPVGAPQPGQVILRRTTARTSDGVVICRWLPQNEQVETAGDFPWFLEFQPSYADTPGPSPIPQQKDGWRIWIPGDAVVGGTLYEVAYLTSPRADQVEAFPEAEELNTGPHFHCLGINRFWYLGSLGNESVPASDAELVGWPLSLTIEPYYGEQG